MDRNKLKFELVLPCYNEANSIERLVEKCITSAIEFGFTRETFKLVLVENGSRDTSRTILEQLSTQEDVREWIKVVFIDFNQGYGFGIHEGLLATTAPVVGWTHADEQCDPKDAFRAWNVLQQCEIDRAIVKGIRTGRSFKERFVSRVFDTLASLILGSVFYEINAQPKVFFRSLISKANNCPKDFSFDLYFLYTAIKNDCTVHSINVLFPPRVHGFSNWAYGMKNRVHHIRNMIAYMIKLSRTEGKL